MKLVFIYGPPATGKYTVGKELAKITGFKLFHNHLTHDLIESLFDFEDEIFQKLSEKYRLDLIETAAKYGIKGVIFTFCYAKGVDEKFVKKVIEAVENHGGKIHFVQLYSDKKELYKRVMLPSRKQLNKIKARRTLKKSLSKWKLFSKIPFVSSLSIDNTNVSAKKTASRINSHYSL